MGIDLDLFLERSEGLEAFLLAQLEAKLDLEMSAIEVRVEIEEMHLDVFTPREPGSVPAWITLARPNEERRTRG